VATLDGISPAIAFLAGLVSFVSPCVLPLVPAYLAYLGARAGQPAIAAGPGAAAIPVSPSLPVAAAGAGFVAGLSLVFILFFAGGFVLGMGFASGWTPCIGVTLSAVLSSAVSAGTTAQGLILMIAYCLGLGLPFIALAFGLERARPLVRLINSHRRAIDLASAAVLLVMGLLLLTNKLTILAAGISQLVPSWPSPTL